MGVADEIRLSRQADQDLEIINGGIEPMLFGELDRIPDMSEDECPRLPWEAGTPPRHKADLGAFTAIFFVETTEAGKVAVIEFVRNSQAIKGWWAELEVQAAEEEARVEREERLEQGATRSPAADER